jgi:hypothetical protein
MKFGGMHYQRLLIRHGIDIGKINIVWAATSIKFSNRHPDFHAMAGRSGKSGVSGFTKLNAVRCAGRTQARAETKNYYKQKEHEWNLWAVRQIFLAAKPVLIDLCVTLASPVLTIPSKPPQVCVFVKHFPCTCQARWFGGKWEALGYGCKLAGRAGGVKNMRGFQGSTGDGQAAHEAWRGQI